MEIFVFIIIIISICVIFSFITISLNKLTPDENNTNNYSKLNNYEYYLKKCFMTKTELYFFNVLKELEDELNIVVHPQLNLASIIYKKTYNNNYHNELFRNIDFAVFSKNYEKLLLLIEINDSTHKQVERIQRDKNVDIICKKANIELIKFYTDKPNEEKYIKDRIKGYMEK